MNANNKGKRFEREVAKLLNKKFDANVRRTPQSGGMSIKGDIIQLSGILSRFHWECKHQETINIWKYIEQAESDAISKIPVVVFKRNHSDIYACLSFEDLMNLIKEIEEQIKNFKEV